MKYLKNIKAYNAISFILMLIGFYYGLNFLYDYGTYSYSLNELEFSNFLNFSLKVFQNLIFFFLFVHLFINIQYRFIGLLLPLAIQEQQFYFFGKIHFFLLDNGIYHYFSKSPNDISAEYPRIWFFMFILFVYIILFLFKRFRKFDKIFLFLGALGTFITAVIFHTVIIAEINLYKNQQKELIFNIHNETSSIDDIQFFCKNSKYLCLSYEPDLYLEFLNNNSIPNYIKPHFNLFHKKLSEPSFFIYSIATDFSAQNRVIAQKPFAISKNKHFITLFIDAHYYGQFLIRNQTIFALLSFTSHTVWFFGSIFLIWFHRRKIKNMQSRMFKF